MEYTPKFYREAFLAQCEEIKTMNAEIDALRRVRSEAINWRNIATQEKRDMERKLAAATDALAACRAILRAELEPKP